MVNTIIDILFTETEGVQFRKDNPEALEELERYFNPPTNPKTIGKLVAFAAPYGNEELVLFETDDLDLFEKEYSKAFQSGKYRQVNKIYNEYRGIL